MILDGSSTFSKANCSLPRTSSIWVQSWILCTVRGTVAFSGGGQSLEDSTSLLMVPVSQSSAGRYMHEPDRDNEFYIPYGQMVSVTYSSSAGGLLSESMSCQHLGVGRSVSASLCSRSWSFLTQTGVKNPGALGSFPSLTDF